LTGFEVTENMVFPFPSTSELFDQGNRDFRLCFFSGLSMASIVSVSVLSAEVV
jgi:hypothetical protein